MTLTIVKDRPLTPEQTREKEDLLDPKKFQAKHTCGIVIRSDKEITEKTICICEQVPEDKRLKVCNDVGHYELLSKGQIIFNWSCKRCKWIKEQETPEQMERSQKLRTEQQEESRTAAAFLKKQEERKAESKAKEKKTEAELFALILVKHITPLFNDLTKEIRNDREKK